MGGILNIQDTYIATMRSISRCMEIAYKQYYRVSYVDKYATYTHTCIHPHRCLYTCMHAVCSNLIPSDCMHAHPVLSLCMFAYVYPVKLLKITIPVFARKQVLLLNLQLPVHFRNSMLNKYKYLDSLIILFELNYLVSFGMFGLFH